MTGTSFWRLLPDDHECSACGHAGAVVLTLTLGSEAHVPDRVRSSVWAECRYCGHDEPRPDHEAASEHWHPMDFEGRDPAGRCFSADGMACRIAHEANEPGSVFTSQLRGGMFEGVVMTHRGDDAIARVDRPS